MSNHMARPRRAYRKAVTPETASRLARRPSAPLPSQFLLKNSNNCASSSASPPASAQRASAVMCGRMVLSRCKRDRC